MPVFSRSELVIATRKSKLALWQAEFIQQSLMRLQPGLTVRLLPLSTEGDERLEVSLAKIGGKGLFIKELEAALLRGEADLAVHSIKDMPAVLPPEFTIAAICARDDVRDVLISRHGENFISLPKGAKIGTSSLRRQVQLKHQRPDLVFESLRGNVPTRLQKLKAGQYDAIVLAAAGMRRLGFQDEITEYFSVEKVLPACGQGALGIECRTGDTEVLALLNQLHEPTVARCVMAERAMNAKLNGSCQVPIAAFATYQNNMLALEGRVGDLTGQRLLKAFSQGEPQEAIQIGEAVAADLIQQGAKAIIDEILSEA